MNGAPGCVFSPRPNFPNGEAGLLAVSRKIHDAGLKFGLHNWEMVVYKHDPLVKPVPADLRLIDGPTDEES